MMEPLLQAAPISTIWKRNWDSDPDLKPGVVQPLPVSNKITAMAWIQIHLTTQKQHVALIELLLEELGALSVTMLDAKDQPLLEPAPDATPMWDQVKVTGMFPDNCDPKQLCQEITSKVTDNYYTDMNVERLPDQVWERAWMEDYKPMCFGENLWIVPDGSKVDNPDAVFVQLDPGLAFGTGTHPTTSLCLGWLDQADMEGGKIIDFGCGSGILAIAALLLGAEEAIAVDHDPQALQATADNARKNGVLDRMVIKGSEQPIVEIADITMANILATTLIELEPLFAAHTRHGGQIILSGILEQQTDSVLAAFADDFTMQAPVTEEEWVLLYGIRN